MTSSSIPRICAVALAGALLAMSSCGCSKSTTSAAETSADAPPAAPSFDGWTVKSDVVVPSGHMYDTETRLEGKLKALRNTVYEVNGRKVQVNVVIPVDSMEADKIFRILANKKPAWAYVRKGDVLYEFVGQNESMEDIQKAHASLSAR